MATIYKRGKSWYLQFRHDGALKRTTLGKITKREAEAILYDVVKEFVTPS